MVDSNDKKPDFSDVVSGSSSTASSPGAAGGAKNGPRSDLDKAETMRMYVIENGDSLSKIARKFYGDANAWKRIFEENRDVIKNPDLIQPGWKIRIPE